MLDLTNISNGTEAAQNEDICSYLSVESRCIRGGPASRLIFPVAILDLIFPARMMERVSSK